MKKNQKKSIAILIAATSTLGAGLFFSSPASSTSAPIADNKTVAPPIPQQPVAKPVRPRIDVVFALDTTGSMSGMIAGAKDKIWSLANEIAAGQPRPIVRFGLVGYRDQGDDYVTKVSGLSEDMDAMYTELMGFTADGGGDHREHVNQALADSLDKMEWQQGQNVLRIVFLVGDAPPHEDYNDGLRSDLLAKRAQERGIIINTIRTGSDNVTGKSWKKIAMLAGGKFHSIAQNGGMLAVTTPYDNKLAALNRILTDTTVAYGTAGARRKVRSKMSNRYAMKKEVAASAASFSAKKTGGGLGRGDLLEELESGAVSIDKLDSRFLDDSMRGMSGKQQRALIQKKQLARQRAQVELKKLSVQRDAWVNKKTKGERDSMDRSMMGAVKEQASDLGVSWER